MRKLISLFVLSSITFVGYAQIDTISKNLFQLNGKIGIGRVNYSSLDGLSISNSRLHVSDSTNHDASIIVSHLHKSGYGFARTLHMVNEGVTGDPFTEFRVRNTLNTNTVTSWSIGLRNSDDDKLIISNATNVSTGSSPSGGNEIMTMKTTGEVGIGTSEPKAKLEIADGDIYINDINKGIIMKSPNGQCWRGTLDNSGNLRFALIDCPKIVKLETD